MTLELTLSRAEMKRLAGKLVAGSRDQANYRAITDVEAAKQVGRRNRNLLLWCRRCVRSGHCFWTDRPGFESRPGAFPQCGLRGGRSHCVLLFKKYVLQDLVIY